MKFILIVVSLVFMMTQVDSQTKKLVAGSKYTVTQESKFSNSSKMMGNDIEATIISTMIADVEIKRVKDSVIVVACTIKRVKGKATAMGQDNVFDSDDSATMNNPMIGDALKDLNKAQEYTVVNGKIKATKGNLDANMPSLTKTMDINCASIVGTLFLPLESKNKKEGYKWTNDEVDNDGTQKAISIFTISKLNVEQEEITANTTLSSKGKSKMMGMEVNQNLTGTRNSVLNYNSSGLLNTATQEVTMSGTAEIMDNSIPINSKGTITTTVK